MLRARSGLAHVAQARVAASLTLVLWARVSGAQTVEDPQPPPPPAPEEPAPPPEQAPPPEEEKAPLAETPPPAVEQAVPPGTETAPESVPAGDLGEVAKLSL